MADNQHIPIAPKTQGTSPLNQLQAAMTSVYGLADGINFLSESAFMRDGEEATGPAYVAEALAAQAKGIGEALEAAIRALQAGGSK